MKRVLTWMSILSLSFTSFASEMVLFDGKDLSHFKEPKQNIWWSVDEGDILCKSDPKKKGSTLWTQKNFKDFVVELKFKMLEGTVDSGVFLRNSDQIQIGISGSLKRDMTTSPYIPKKGYPKESEGVKENLKPKEWNSMKIKAKGPVYTVWLNGIKVNEYTSETSVVQGPIGLQLHGNRDMAIRFKDIVVEEI